MDVAAYLDRIGYSGPTAAGIETLRGLHRAHLLRVPFENLDIHLGRPIVLDETRLFAKIIGGRRGGFCYELNGLFAVLLENLGFRVTRLSAGVAHTAGGYGPEFDHLALLVEAGGRHLADVGFGEGFIDPLPFDSPSTDGYRLERAGEYHVLLRGDQPSYRFTLAPHRLADYAAMCHYHQSSPQSSFTSSRLATLATADGRITLTDTRLIVAHGGHREESPVEDPADFRSLCEKHFGIYVGD